MKKIFSNLFLIMILSITLFLTGCQKKEVKVDKTEKETATPLFYKISNNETDATIYLLGSIHVADNSIYPLNDTIMSAYYSSEYLAVETDTTSIDNDLQLELNEKMLYKEGTTIKDELGDELYNKMVEILKAKKSYTSLFDNYKPIFFESLLGNVIAKEVGLNANKGVDMYFLNLAEKDGKEVLEIETIEFQYDLLLNSPIELHKLLIDSYVNSYNENVLAMEYLYEAWKKGDIVALEKNTFEFNKEQLTEKEIIILEDYIQSFIIDRNYSMSSALEKYMLENKNVFCVVGVAHLVGDEGIIALMKKEGYNVENLQIVP